MRKFGILIYKCKLCGVQFEQSAINGKEPEELARRIIDQWHEDLSCVHHCDEENIDVVGIAELIGVRVQREEV